jgi:hypothetical protein
VIWIINGRCEGCLEDDHDWAMCGCWCHDTCPDCGRAECTGEDCYWPEEAGLR